MMPVSKIRGGYILLSRKIIESEIWLKPPLYLKVWIYLLCKAQHSKYKGLDKGCLRTSIPEIIDECQWKVGYRTVRPTKDQVYRVLDWMRNASTNATMNATMITTTNATHGILAKVENYCFYQDPKNYERNDEHNDERATTPDNINKNDKNDKNDKKINPPIVPPLGDGDKSAKNIQEQRFEHFWKTYPKKRSKGQAEKAWNKIKPNEQLHNRIMQSLERAKTSADWIKENGQFIPYPATWLNAKGWEDEYKEAQINEREAKRDRRRASRTDNRDWEKLLGID
jgi:hypothetical protein